ncbi:MAG: hypothetical protein WCL19_07275 [Verrucomicrobiota bacterium]
MLNSKSIQGIIALIVGTVLAIWIGFSLVTDQSETLLYLAATSLVLISGLLGQRVWLLFLFFYAANVVLLMGFGSVQIGQMIFIGFSLLLFLMRKLKFTLSFGELEIWGLLLVASIVQAYLRNPVGLNLFGGSEVGGRPYVFMIIGITAAVILSAYQVNPKDLKWAMRLSMLGIAIGIPSNVLRSGITLTEEGLSRIPALNSLGQLIAQWLVTRLSPLKACLRPLWSLLLLISIAAAAGSGYRNAIAGTGLIYAFGVLYWNGRGGLFASFIAIASFLSLLAIINLNFPLPGNIQRALSPFPGTWEEQYVKVADDSTEWRQEMWIEALTSKRWIHNKILGDGIGFSKADLETNQRMKDMKIGKLANGMSAQQEAMLINGSYHSGPVQTIRSTGYVGMLILVLAMIRTAVHAHRQILRCRSTEWFPVALFFCIPIIILPIFFCLIFGEFSDGVRQTMMSIAMVKLLEKNLPLPRYTRIKPIR